MQILTGLAAFAILMAVYAAFAPLLARWSITMPMVFVVLGATLGTYGLDVLPIRPDAENVKRLTEATLAILLFADASTLNLKRIQRDVQLPARLLAICLPLTIALGALVAFFEFPGQGLGFALLLGTILAPTDAALGLPIFTNPRVPVRIRRALNVESGLNDGIATPFMTLFIAMAVAQEASSGDAPWLASALLQLGIAVIVGSIVGAAGGWLLAFSSRRGWTSGTPLQYATLALAAAAYLCSLALDGNGFVAAFVGGIAFGAASRGALAEAAEFTETTGTLLSVLVWTIFGASFVIPYALQQVDGRVILYAVLSLTVIRMLPAALALRGNGFRRDTVLLMGWFGPRGLASVVFGLMAVDALMGAEMEHQLLGSVVTWAILLSVMAHGLSAQPLASWYARRLTSAPPDIPEMEDVPEIRPRNMRRFSGAAAPPATGHAD